MILTCRRNYKSAYLKKGSGTERLFHSPKELQWDKAETPDQLPLPLSQTFLLPLLPVSETSEWNITLDSKQYQKQ